MHFRRLNAPVRNTVDLVTSGESREESVEDYLESKEEIIVESKEDSQKELFDDFKELQQSKEVLIPTKSSSPKSLSPKSSSIKQSSPKSLSPKSSSPKEKLNDK
ncbi:hypothetical protein RFI_37239 [Reticulomyxa filosa]|uniref:Uncharacterized protein n=1 Tax=Reticulomyxa filosa TaxID=46433 RepID=X6LDX3_RETFI|nr:hypothetical protein RFI_37239 [Reticulomyxa filosa]|eukprot:ETO00208.1 hypothetical protein RFI_37239 [Reticulomyxa filosa]